MTADEQLKKILIEKGLENCRSCSREIDRGDIAWNSPSTEEGTDYTVVQITCQQCGTEIAHVTSWYPSADSFEELVESILAREEWE
jgi:hypothetical protein